MGILTSLFSLTYEGPRRVVKFGYNEPNGLGFIREGAGHGPLRLLVSDTAIYLLARYDHRLYTFDLYGKVTDSIHFPFCPGDFTYDSEGRFHVIQHRVVPQFITVFERGVKVDSIAFDLPGITRMTEIACNPLDEILAMQGGYTYRMSETGDRRSLLFAGERPGRFHLVNTHLGWTEAGDEYEFTGTYASGQVITFMLQPLARELFQFQADDREGRIYITGTSIQLDDEGNKYVARRLLVFEDGEVAAELTDMDAGSSTYDFANHDIAIAPNGDIYLFRTHLVNFYSEILRWRLTQ